MLGVRGYPANQPQSELGKMLDPHPMERKMELAELIVADFDGKDAAGKAAEHFQRVFRDRQAPAEMREIKIMRAMNGYFFAYQRRGETIEKTQLSISSTGTDKWARILAGLKQVDSASEAERIIKQGGFEVNREIVKDPASKVDLTVSGAYAIRVGKKNFFRIVVE